MVKVNNAHLTMNGSEITDRKSWVVEVNTWEDFIKDRKSGLDLTWEYTVRNVVYDDLDFSRDIIDSQGNLIKHLAYLDENL